MTTATTVHRHRPPSTATGRHRRWRFSFDQQPHVCTRLDLGIPDLGFVFPLEHFEFLGFISLLHGVFRCCFVPFCRVVSMSDSSIFPPNINVHLPIDKLDGKNYSTCAPDVKVWLESQGYLDHLTLKLTDVDITEFPRWKRIDAHLCMVLKNTIHASLKQQFRAYGTSYEVWEQVKLLYSNDTQCLYGVCQDLLNVVASHTQDPVAYYVGKVTELFHEFKDVLPIASTLAQEIEQRSHFFMVMMLHGLPEKYSHVRDQILGSTVIPNFTSTCSTLLREPCQPFVDPPIHANDFSALVSHSDDRHRSR